MKLKNIPFLKIHSIKNTILFIGTLTILTFFGSLVSATEYFDCDMNNANSSHDVIIAVPSEKQYDSWSEEKKRESQLYDVGFQYVESEHLGLFRAPYRFVQVTKTAPYDEYKYIVHSFNTKHHTMMRFYASYVKEGEANPKRRRFDAFEFIDPPDDPEYVEREAFVKSTWVCEPTSYFEYLRRSLYFFLLEY